MRAAQKGRELTNAAAKEDGPRDGLTSSTVLAAGTAVSPACAITAQGMSSPRLFKVKGSGGYSTPRVP